jgi:hypothetical protein
MNRRMLSRSQGGFTTCVILRIEPKGSVTVANADHLAPYLGGQEMAVENGLPLGITAETDYPESDTPLPVGVQLTLYTDGVIEARARSGELFGFERAAALSRRGPPLPCCNGGGYSEVFRNRDRSVAKWRDLRFPPSRKPCNLSHPSSLVIPERSVGICSAPCGSLKSFPGSGPDESALPNQALTPQPDFARSRLQHSFARRHRRSASEST